MTEWKSGQVILDDYTVESELGRGGMGRVWLVKSNSTGRRFAVKQALVGDEKNRKAFLAELQTWIDLPEHPNIVPCRFFRTVGDEIVIFADYVEGGSLADWIAKRKLTTLEQILDVAIQFAWGLYAIHERGLIHQDVKPGNVLMTPDGVPMITDFGLARARLRGADGFLVSPALPSGQQSVLVSSGGMTPAYASPEQRAGKPLSRKTDIWSWGVSVLDMFMGGISCPPGGHIAAEVLEGFIEDGQKQRELPKMPEDLAFLLRKCFERTYENRLPDFLQVVEASKGTYERSCHMEYKKVLPLRLELEAPQQPPCISDRYIKTPEEWLKYARRAAGLSDAPVATFASSEQGSLVRALILMSEARRLLADLITNGRTDMAREFADASWVHADLHRRLSDWNGCLDVWRVTVELLSRASRDSGHRVLLADVLYWQGQVLADVGQPQAACRSCRAAIDILVALPHTREHLITLAKTYQLHARSLAAQGLNDEARTDYQGAIETLREFAKQFPDDSVVLRPLALGLHNWAGLESKAGSKDKAVSLYRQAIRIREAMLLRLPADDLTRSSLAGSYSDIAAPLADLGDYSAALAAAGKAVAIREQLIGSGALRDFSEGLARAYFNEAGLLLQMGRHEDAVEEYWKALAILVPLVYLEGRSDLLTLLGHVRSNNDEALRAIERTSPAAADTLYEKHVGRFKSLVMKGVGGVMIPQLAMLMSNWAGVRDSLGKQQEGTALLRDAMAMLDTGASTRFSGQWREALALTCLNLGMALARDRKHADARTFLEKARHWLLECGALQKGPPLLLHFGRTCVALAHQYAFAGENRAASGLVTEAMTAIDTWRGENRSGLAVVLEAAGGVLATLGEHQRALTCFDKALAIDPQCCPSLIGKANVLDALGQHEKALACYDEVLAIDPRNACAWGNKGVTLDALGRHGEAITCLDHALTIDPRQATAWFVKGNALDGLGRHKEAVICFDKTLALEPHYVAAYFNKACAEDMAGDAASALRSYGTFLKGASAEDVRQISHARKRIQQLNSPHVGHGDARSEITNAGRTQGLNPQNGEAINERIQSLLDDGQIDKAVSACHQLQGIAGWEILGVCKEAQILAAKGEGMAAYLLLNKWLARYQRSTALWFTMAVILRPISQYKQQAVVAARNAMECCKENPKELSPDNFRYLERMILELSGRM